jgi:hypothetical protein
MVGKQRTEPKLKSKKNIFYLGSSIKIKIAKLRT